MNKYNDKFWRYVQYCREAWSMYFGITLTFINFIILFYNFIIIKYGLLDINIVWFGIFGGISLFVLTVVIGFLHYKNNPFKQIAIVGWDNNPRAKELSDNVKDMKKDIEEIKKALNHEN